MMRLMRGSERGSTDDRSAFDPIVEGARHRLAADLALAIWTRACADATDSAGQIDIAKAKERFYQIATTGVPDVGKRSSAGLAHGLYRDSPPRDLANGVPGRITAI